MAQLAQQRLSPTAQRAVRTLLGQDARLASIASWADAESTKKRADSYSHAVRLPYKGGANFKFACGKRRCALEGIEHYYPILADRTAPAAKRLIALKYLVHLVADTQQPLHCVQYTGSARKVSWRGHEYSLHKLWDSGILASRGSAGAVARQLNAGITAQMAAGSPRDWVLQCYGLALSDVYADVKPGSTGVVALLPDYADRHWPVVALQLQRAAARLAAMLNRALANG